MTTTELTPSEELAQLAQADSDYQQGERDLKAYRDKGAQAQADLDRALSSEGDEDVAASQIQKAQTLIQINEARSKQREAEQERRASQLGTAVQAATRAFTKLLAAEIDRRTVLVTERVLAALDVDQESLAIHEKLALNQYIGALPEFSRSIRAISRLHVSSYYAGQANDRLYASNAAQVLNKNFELFLKETS